MSYSIEHFAIQLRGLVAEYYRQKITVIEYRQERKIILDQADSDINHINRLMEVEYQKNE